MEQYWTMSFLFTPLFNFKFGTCGFATDQEFRHLPFKFFLFVLLERPLLAYYYASTFDGFAYSSFPLVVVLVKYYCSMELINRLNRLRYFFFDAFLL